MASLTKVKGVVNFGVKLQLNGSDSNRNQSVDPLASHKRGVSRLSVRSAGAMEIMSIQCGITRTITLR